jgi:hypothetical protein
MQKDEHFGQHGYHGTGHVGDVGDGEQQRFLGIGLLVQEGL